MPFLSINGIPFPVALEGYEEQIREISGGVVSSYGGFGNKSFYAKTRNDFTIESSPILDAEALAWENLIRGFGETWSFNSTFTGSKGSRPQTTTGLSITAAAPVFASSNKLLISANSPIRIWRLITTEIWTVSVWYSTNASALVHYLVTSDGRKWVNGVRNDAAVTTWLFLAGNEIRVNGDLVVGTNVDDFVLLPFTIPTTWGPYFYGLFNTYGQTYSLLPKLTLLGDTFPTARTYFGNVTASRPVRAAGGIRRILSIKMTEA